MHFCTIATTIQLPQVKVLAASLKRHHPACRFATVVLDASPGAQLDQSGCELLTLEHAGFEPTEARQLPMLRSVDELNTMALPRLLLALLACSDGPVIYLSPCVEVFAPLDEIAALVAAHGIVTSPVVEWRPSHGTHDALQTFPAALVAAGESGRSVLRSWSDASRPPAGLADAECLDADKVRPTDLFVVNDSRWDAGFWILPEQPLTWDGNHYFLGGRRLGCFRFEGYEPEKPHLLSKHLGTHPRVLLSENPALLKICEEYRQKLFAAGYDASREDSGLEVLPSGLRIDAHMRDLYREALERFWLGSGPEPPSPFGPGGETAFLSWINEPMAHLGAPTVTRYMLAIHKARSDVRDAFPQPLGADASAFWGWYVNFGRGELQIPAALLPPDTPATAAPRLLTHAVNVAGFFRAELGIGEAARLLVTALAETNVPHNVVTFSGTTNRQEHPFDERRSEAASDINIVCVNADQFPTFVEKTGPEFFAGKYTIGVWFWEVDEFPETFHAAFNYVDEIWVASEFARRPLLKVSPKPVVKFDLPIVKPVIDASATRSELGLPAGFVFLFSFDFLSVLERKNPLGLIEAFQQAFSPGEGPKLVLKTINGDQRIREMEKLKFAARGRPDIRLLDGYMSAVEKNTLIAACDCYISLHRAEGFGLTMAEAMALGKPVIATRFSANLEFMTEENSYLCDFELSQVGAECEPYPATAHWATPNVDHAASLMRSVYMDQAEASARGRRAAEDVARCHSPAMAGRALRERIAVIRQRRARRDSPRSIDILEDRVDALEKSHSEIVERLKGGGNLSGHLPL